ncbi:MAG: thioredoxin family protein, partial [Alphaproteobacteria bacterium]
IAMLGIFALSLIDRVIIPVPRFVQALAGTTAGTTARTDMATGGQPYRGDFLAGMLATILATPCSAPFVGTAVAAALSGGMVDLFGIFLAMGVGLSAPWMLVAANPSLVAMLPRPGPWMVWMKRVLALLLVGTMIWLGSVLATVVGGERAQAAGDELWQSWSMQAMQDSLAAGTPVFVDVTADWCVTCKANKALVLERDPVAGALTSAVADGSLVLLRADWTRPDAEIAAFLASHGRYGIPFNMLLTPGGRNDIVFAEILTSSAIIKALENVARTAK